MLVPRVLLVFLLSALGVTAFAADSSRAGDSTRAEGPDYRLQPGDVMEVSVWKETDLVRDVLIRPDGQFSFPLAGDIDAVGKSIDEVRGMLVERLKRYIPTPVVTVALKSIGGNRVYVLGKVNRAGEYLFVHPVDVMQAIGLAGGTTPFAALNDIVILRRQNGRQEAFSFRYLDVAHGRDLSQNIVLHSGDTVVVP
jgi:polysaccharide biosynthesis/export protein